MEIQRYEKINQWMEKNQAGEWVKYDDIKHLLDRTDSECMEDCKYLNFPLTHFKCSECQRNPLHGDNYISNTGG